MKVRDILSVVDIDRIEAEDLIDILRRMGRQPDVDETTPELLYAQYGDEADDLAIEQQRADLARTRAQVDKLRADADRARAEADAQRAGSRPETR